MNKIVGGSAEDYHRKQQEERQKKKTSSGVGGLVELHAQAMSDFFVGFNQAAKALAEAVFVHFIHGFFIPQTAAVRREFIPQHHFAFEQT